MAEGQKNGSQESLDDENFEDANEVIPVKRNQCPSEMNLESSIQETVFALNLFLNNRFSEAKARMEPWADSSMYHAVGYGTLMYLQAAMTFDTNDIELAVASLRRCIVVCNKHRKKYSLVAALTRTACKVNYDNYTEEEVHAELCYAECLIERALLNFVQNENLISFLQGSLKIKACYSSYKECLKMLQRRKWKSSKEKMHFESGVRLGIGLFNLMISLLPTKVLKLLEFVGFSGNKSFGLAQLEGGAALDRSVRGPLCSMALLGYHTVMAFVLGAADGDIELSERLLSVCLSYYPQGAMFLFFAGRIEEIKGNIDDAIYKFEESVDAQEEWKQFHHLCFWELMWCHSFKCDWLLAMKYAERLCKESRWSKATYTYQKAAFLLMCDDQSSETQQHIQYLFKQIPRLKQRIAGKSIPIEKFAVRKAERYHEQQGMLVLPAIELIYVWNGFFIIGKNVELLMGILEIVEKSVSHISNNKDTFPNFYDNYSLALLLKGVCLRHRGQHFQAEQCLNEVLENKKQVKYDTYLMPYATLELGMLQMTMGNYEQAKDTLNLILQKYKGYTLESRLHFRMHAAQLQLKAILDPESVQASNKDYEKELLSSNHIDHLKAQEAACETDSVGLPVDQ